MSNKNSSDTIGNQSCDLPVCSAVPQPLRHRMPLHKTYIALLNVHNDQLKGTQNSGNEEKFPTDTIKCATYLLNEPFHSVS
jgi:hypothetical protein